MTTTGRVSSARLQSRPNLLEPRLEAWRPPLFRPTGTRFSGLLRCIRGFFDLPYGSILRDLSAELPEVRGTLLDVGCGAQPYRNLLDPTVKYIGLDTTDAEAHFGYRMPDTLYCDGDRWPVEDGSLDAVLATEVLEHVVRPPRFLGEAIRCLRPGGRLMLTVPLAARWHFIPYDYWRFTPSGFRLLLDDAGFVRPAVYARGNALSVACYKVMALILLLAMPTGRSFIVAWCLRVLAIPFLPLFVLLAAVGTLSLGGRGGDDCLGYTVLAFKPE